MSEASGQERNRTPNAAAGAALLLVLVYIFFPVVFVFPLVLVYGKDSPPEWVSKGLYVTFTPVRYLYERVPAYKQLIDAEGKMLHLN